MASVGALAKRLGLKIHVDGARIFNAAVALKVSATALAKEADSLSFCLSKGLAAPVGSLVCGSRDFIDRARRARKILGGGMRQAGILAAAGIIALNENVDRLAEDHIRARKLAEGLSDIDGLAIDVARVKTNLVFFDVTKQGMDAAALVERLETEGVRMLALGPFQIRAVTHYHIGSEDIDNTLAVIARVMKT